MDARELRIGNYLMTDDREIVTVLRVDRDGMLVQPVPDEYDGGFHPIPLDEEWLLNFGFNKSDGGYMSKRTIHSGLHWKDNLMHLNYSLGWAVKCQYVHQLQNLYYSLVGTDLVCIKKG